MLTNYFCSCTANFGVVPLFLLMAFLLAPTFDFFALRILLVLPVKEAITTNLLHFKMSEGKYLTIKSTLVKLALGASCFFPVLSQAASSTLYLAKGEQKELQFSQIKQFSIGNKEVLGHKLLPSKGKILIKGKGQGFSDLFIWVKDGQRVHHKIYVLNKGEHSKQLALAGALASIGLESHFEGEVISVTGQINKISDWTLLKKIEDQNDKILHINVELAPEFFSEIISKIYGQFIELGADFIKCRSEGILLNCIWSGDDEAINAIIIDLQKQLPIKFQKTSSLLLDTNFEIKLTVVKIEFQNTQEISLGTDQINTTIQDLVTSGAISLIKENTIKLKNIEMKMNTLAEPQMIINLNKAVSIEVGAEISYQNVSARNPNVSFTQWKFAGLKVQLKLTRKNNQFYLDYETEFSRPNLQNISTSKQSASSFINLNKKQTLFEILYQGDAKGVTGIPGLKDIPLLGTIFTSSQKENSTQKIVAVVELKRKEEK